MSRRNYGMWNGCHSDKQTTSEIYDRERSKARWFLIYWRVRLLVSTDHPRQKPYSACDQEHRTQIYSALPAGTWRNNNIITSKTSRRRFGVTMTLLLHHVPTGLYVDEIWIQRERIGWIFNWIWPEWLCYLGPHLIGDLILIQYGYQLHP